MPKIYTRKGDSGFTSLLNGSVIPKHSLEIEIFGLLDELNSYLGFAATSLTSQKSHLLLMKKLRRLQHELIVWGGNIEFGTFDKKCKSSQAWAKRRIKALEKEIDSFQKNVPTIKNFIVTGTNESNARLHLARVVCRRVERSFLKADSELGNKNIAINVRVEMASYLNRLSDWLFMAALTIDSQR